MRRGCSGRGGAARLTRFDFGQVPRAADFISSENVELRIDLAAPDHEHRAVAVRSLPATPLVGSRCIPSGKVVTT